MPNMDLVLGIAIAVIVFWEAFRGWRRGVWWQVVHVILCIVSAVLSYKLVGFITNSLISNSSGSTLESFLGFLEGIGPFESLSLNLTGAASYFEYIELILALPVAGVLSPIIFTFGYFAINTVMQLLFYVIRIFIPRGYTPKTKGFGFLLGMVEGLLICFVILVSFVGVNGMVNDARTVADENYVPEGNAVINLADSLGAGKLVDSMATVTIDGEETNLTTDASNIIAVVIRYNEIKPLDKSHPDAEDREFIESFIDTVGESRYLSTMVSSLLSGAGRAMQDNVVVVQIPAPYNILTNAGFNVFATSSRDNLHSDLHTLFDVYLLLADEGIIDALNTKGAESVMRDAFLVRDESGATLVDRITGILNENEHTKPMINAIAEMSIAMLSETLGLDVDIAEKYNDIKDGINDVLAVDRDNYDTDEEYVAARNDALNTTLTDNGIELDDNIINDMGDYIDENYPDADELTEEEFNDIILSYYDIYEKSLSDGSVSEDILP